MCDSEHFHTTTNLIMNEIELYFHFSPNFHTLFFKNKCIHLSGEIFVTKEAIVAGNYLECFSEFPWCKTIL
jgi:hypothetical protein